MMIARLHSRVVLIYTRPPRDSAYLLLSPLLPFRTLLLAALPHPNTYSSGFFPLSAVCPSAAGASMSAVL
jgi:hypothetical protein